MMGTLVALPAGLFLVSCSSDMMSDDPGAAPRTSGTETIYTSSNVDGHVHTFGLASAELLMPPAAGVTGSTSSDSGHTHAVSVSADQLGSVAAGQSVKVMTSSASGHTHVFTFVKVG